MSKIFRISGNFKKNGKWNDPDPYLTGEIILENNDIFYGYFTDPNETRYLVGVIAEDENGSTDAQFYIMSNNYTMSPVFWNTRGKDGVLEGQWYEMKYHLKNGHPYTFTPKSAAKVFLEKESYSKKAESRIRGEFGNFNQNAAINSRIIKSILEFA